MKMPFRSTMFWGIHSRIFFPEDLGMFSVPKHLNQSFGSFPTKRTGVHLFNAYLTERNSFVANLLCKNLNWNTLRFVSLVQRNGR